MFVAVCMLGARRRHGRRLNWQSAAVLWSERIRDFRSRGGRGLELPSADQLDILLQEQLGSFFACRRGSRYAG